MPASSGRFLVGNILDGEIPELLTGTTLRGTRGKGRPAALISRGQQIGEVDSEQCPIVTSPLLQIGPRQQ